MHKPKPSGDVRTVFAYNILFVGNPVRKGHQTVPEMDVLNLDSGIFERNIVMTEIPEGFDAESHKLVGHRRSGFFGNTENRGIRQIFPAELVKR